ncbi:MAG: hypothetical protein C4293_01220 [Nitrospiraceae bacterium]
MWSPALERLKQARAAYERARQAHRHYQAMRKTEEELRTIWRELPARAQFPGLILAVADLAHQEHVAIPGMSHTVQSIEQGVALKASMTFRATGQYPAIRRFIHRLESSRSSLVIESLDVARNGDVKGLSATVAFNIRVSSYLRADPPGRQGSVGGESL